MKNILYLIVLLPFLGFSQKQFEVFFDFNEDFPNPNSILKLNEWIAENKNVEITKFLGFCDSIDSKNYNKNLAQRRINSVQELLKVSGFTFSKKLEKIAYGKEFKQSKIQSDNRRVTIFYTEIVEKAKISELQEKINTSKIGQTIALPHLYFYNNSARILPESIPSLNDLLCALEENPKLKIEIQGHICCQKTFDLNNLSVSRARAVYVYLIRKGINKKRMTFKGYGTSRPIHPIPEKNADEEEENRRVEVLIVEN